MPWRVSHLFLSNSVWNTQKIKVSYIHKESQKRLPPCMYIYHQPTNGTMAARVISYKNQCLRLDLDLTASRLDLPPWADMRPHNKNISISTLAWYNRGRTQYTLKNVTIRPTYSKDSRLQYVKYTLLTQLGKENAVSDTWRLPNDLQFSCLTWPGFRLA